MESDTVLRTVRDLCCHLTVLLARATQVLMFGANCPASNLMAHSLKTTARVLLKSVCTDQCELEVVNITSTPSLESSNHVATGVSGASEGRLVRGWAKSKLNDPDEVGIDLAWTRAEIKFTLYRDSTVEYPHDRFEDLRRLDGV